MVVEDGDGRGVSGARGGKRAGNTKRTHLHVANWGVQPVLRAVVIIVTVERKCVLQILPKNDGRFVRPAARDVAEGVATAAKNEKGKPLRLDVLDALRVALD